MKRRYCKLSPTYVVVEKGINIKGEQKQALVEPWCEHWSCSGWEKGTSRDETMLNSEEINPIALAVIEVHLSEGIK